MRFVDGKKVADVQYDHDNQKWSFTDEFGDQISTVGCKMKIDQNLILIMMDHGLIQPTYATRRVFSFNVVREKTLKLFSNLLSDDYVKLEDCNCTPKRTRELGALTIN